MWCTAEKRFMRHVCRRNAFLLLFLAKTFNSWRHQKSVRVDYWVANPARTSPGSMFELWISDGFELFFAVHFLYPKFVLARPKQLMPVTVKFQIDVLGCGLQGRLFPSFDVGPMFPCSKSAMQCRKEICSTCLSEESMPFVKSKPPLPSRSLRSLRAAARSTSSLHSACKR